MTTYCIDVDQIGLIGIANKQNVPIIMRKGLVIQNCSEKTFRRSVQGHFRRYKINVSMGLPIYFIHTLMLGHFTATICYIM